MTSFLTKFYGTSTGSRMHDPAPTVTTGGGKGGGHLAEVRAFLSQYNGESVGQLPTSPINTVTTKDRFGLVMVHGEPYTIVDIGMRMLAPRELFRAQSFPDSYVIDGFTVTKRTKDGKMRTGLITKTAQIRMCGNSVAPEVARALVAANAGVSAAEVA